MAFDGVTTNPGSGGAVVMANVFTDTDSVDRVMPYSGLGFGSFDAIPTPVSSSAGLPVAQQGTWTVSVTGVATSGNQDTMIASLASIDLKLPSLGQALSAASVPVVLPVAQITALTPPAAITGFSTAVNQSTIISSLSSIDGHVDGLEGLLASVDAKISACNTSAVVVASSILPTGAATASRQDTGNSSLSSIDSKTPALGQALAAESIPVVLTVSQLETLTPLSTVAATQSGTWTVTGAGGTFPVTGTFWQATQPVSLASVPSHAVTNAGAFAVQSSLETGSIYNGTSALTPKFAAIAASTSGNNTLVLAVSGKKIRVLAYNLIGSAAVNAKFQSGAAGTDLTGLKYIAAAGGGICAPFNPVGWFETGINTLLNLNLSGAVAIGGELVYVEV